MKPKIKRYHSPDIDLRTYSPVEADNFSFLLQVMVGPDDSDACESFDIHVCTPRWLLDNCIAPLWGRHMLIVPSYDFRTIEELIGERFRECTGKDWLSVAGNLARYAKWEFEDYRT